VTVIAVTLASAPTRLSDQSAAFGVAAQEIQPAPGAGRPGPTPATSREADPPDPVMVTRPNQAPSPGWPPRR